MFLERIGVDQSRVRLRQHMGNEMAHYACDCWDTEIKVITPLPESLFDNMEASLQLCDRAPNE
jgi:hypothetical protein